MKRKRERETSKKSKEGRNVEMKKATVISWLKSRMFGQGNREYVQCTSTVVHDTAF